MPDRQRSGFSLLFDNLEPGFSGTERTAPAPQRGDGSLASELLLHQRGTRNWLAMNGHLLSIR